MQFNEMLNTIQKEEDDSGNPSAQTDLLFGKFFKAFGTKPLYSPTQPSRSKIPSKCKVIKDYPDGTVIINIKEE